MTKRKQNKDQSGRGPKPTGSPANPDTGETPEDWHARMMAETDGMTKPGEVLQHLSDDAVKNGPPPVGEETQRWQCGSCGTFNVGRDLSAACTGCGETGHDFDEVDPATGEQPIDPVVPVGGEFWVKGGPGESNTMVLGDQSDTGARPLDPRIVYGVGCTWWESITEVAKHPENGLPCCPNCKGMLMECDNEADWDSQVRSYANREGDPGYVGYIAWLRGKCRQHDKARDEFDATAGDPLTGEMIKDSAAADAVGSAPLAGVFQGRRSSGKSMIVQAAEDQLWRKLGTPNLRENLDRSLRYTIEWSDPRDRQQASSILAAFFGQGDGGVGEDTLVPALADLVKKDGPHGMVLNRVLDRVAELVPWDRGPVIGVDLASGPDRTAYTRVDMGEDGSVESVEVWTCVVVRDWVRDDHGERGKEIECGLRAEVVVAGVQMCSGCFLRMYLEDPELVADTERIE